MDVQTDILYLFHNKDLSLDFKLNFHPLLADRKKRFWDFKAYHRLAAMISAGQYDLIQANAGDTLKYASISKILFKWKAPLVFRNANKMSSFIKNRWHKYLNQIFLSQVDYVISVSENCRADLTRLFPGLRNKSRTITIGTYNYDQVLPMDSEKGGSPLLLHIGSFVPEKNHSFLIDIFHAFLRERSQAKLWLIGEGPLRVAIKKKVAALDIEKSIVFWGTRRDVISLIKTSDILIMPSRIEGLPGVILEALSCGKPVVASNVGGIPEVVQNGLNGYTLPGWNVEDYVVAINKALNRPKYSQMGASGRKMVKDHYLMPVIAEKFLHAYKEIIELAGDTSND